MPVRPTSTTMVLAILAIAAPVSAQTRAELLPESTVPIQVARLLDTGPVPRAQLLEALQRLPLFRRQPLEFEVGDAEFLQGIPVSVNCAESDQFGAAHAVTRRAPRSRWPMGLRLSASPPG